ncbi:NAD(P)/FAD-dependent oxidoreductase [Nocardia sp. NPDC050793]|uniref:flavin-containing monooxygenase n=1 Tax=Nocardia sp. NPDC050793 TaxID=3155159 RepID=UPI00340ED769
MSALPVQPRRSAGTSTAEDSALQVAVVGVGFGGLGMGVALQRSGIHRFAIFDHASDVGGVWRDNTYPGCHCDVPAHLYSLSAQPYRDTRIRYPSQPQILAYLRSVVANHDLGRHLRLGAAITQATYLDDQACWELITGDGERVLAEAVVFAVGQLHRPHLPEIPGRDTFTGPVFHTARWDHDVDLCDKDIAVVGTGASAAQILPHLTQLARHVRVFQRTPHWVLPKPATGFGPITRTMLRLPGAHHFYRHSLGVGADAVLAPIMRRGWSARPTEWAARRYLQHQVSDPVLRAKLTPHYPLGGKRIIFDNHYYRSLTRPNVELVTEPITGINPNGIQTAGSTTHPADAIIYATGFKASEFLLPIDVRGRGEISLHQQWRNGARAFFGLAVPGYPNAFLIAGPNSFNPAGSNPAMKQHQIDYIIDCLRWRDQIGTAAIEVSHEAMRAHQRWLDDALAHTVWPAVTPSWFKHPTGRITNPWPASTRRYKRLLRRHAPARTFTAHSTRTTATTPNPTPARQPENPSVHRRTAC